MHRMRYDVFGNCTLSTRSNLIENREKQEAMVERRKALELNPKNWIIYKQIWAVEHPDNPVSQVLLTRQRSLFGYALSPPCLKTSTRQENVHYFLLLHHGYYTIKGSVYQKTHNQTARMENVIRTPFGLPGLSRIATSLQ